MPRLTLRPHVHLIRLIVNLLDTLSSVRARLRARKDQDVVLGPAIKAYDFMFASEVDLNDLVKGYRQEAASELFQISREQYVAGRDANTHGTANPSVMNYPFWIFQVGPGGGTAWKARTTFGNPGDHSTDLEDPVWCFHRFGATFTKLPDGRVVCIGGEHEDDYDPDFCIYNDVVVFDAPQKSDPPPLLTPEYIKIYGYPVDIFPPTDFHTSTYFANPTTGKESMIIIGGLGYAGQASRDQTDVYQLDLTDFSIQRLVTSGTSPTGGTSHHKAELIAVQGQAAIKITTQEGKELIIEEGGTASTTTEEGEKSSDEDESRESTIPDRGKVTIAISGPVTTDRSKVFTLRIYDMRWI
ncbi:MAG: hypothetical protein Q9175_003084 [Cornicularia normoerica]